MRIYRVLRTVSCIKRGLIRSKIADHTPVEIPNVTDQRLFATFVNYLLSEKLNLHDLCYKATFDEFENFSSK